MDDLQTDLYELPEPLCLMEQIAILRDEYAASLDRKKANSRRIAKACKVALLSVLGASPICIYIFI